MGRFFGLSPIPAGFIAVLVGYTSSAAIVFQAASAAGAGQAGGADVRQFNPATMGSKLIRGLYAAGEVLDVDALTGGFNLHIAFATGFCAGSAAAKNGDAL